MKFDFAGGTGLAGSRAVTKLPERDHDAQAASRVSARGRRGEDVATSPLLRSIPIIDSVLDQHRSVLDLDFIGYRNHVYRVVNLCVAMVGGSRADLEMIAIAAVYHDLGIWTDHTFDYITPSVSLAREYLASHSRADWIPEVEAMIVNHHKITRAQANSGPLVEVFRRADWIDVSRGFRRFRFARTFIKTLFAVWPSAGFHWRLVELTIGRFRRHPLSPLPMVRL